MRGRLYLACLSALAGGVMSGCSGSQVARERERELAELREENASHRDKIAELLAKLSAVHGRAERLEKEHKAATAQAAELEKTVRSQKENIERLTKDRVHLEGRLLEAEHSYEALKKTLQEVQDVAAKTAESYADLRLKKGERDERMATLERLNQSLRSENRRLADATEALEAELRRDKAVLRSVHSQDGRDLAKELKSQISELEDANQKLRSERVRLLEKLRELAPAGEAEKELLAGGSGSPALYRDDPEGLWKELLGFVTLRFGDMVRGRAKWDAHDIGLAAGAGGLIIFVLWWVTLPVRWRRRRAVRVKVRALERRLKAAESREPSASGAAASRGAARRQPAARMVRRAEHFSPIFSAETEEEAEPAERILPPADEEPPARGASGGRTAAGRAARGSRVIGAPQWSDDDTRKVPDRENEDEEFSNTQVISGGELVDLPELSREAEAGDEDDDFGNTQIVSPRSIPEEVTMRLDEPVEPAGPRAGEKKKAGESSQELLDELEDLIGKKVDEMIQ